MDPGDTVVLRATGEHARVVAVLDSSGTLLLRVEAEEFEAARDDVEWPWAKHVSCACCG